MVETRRTSDYRISGSSEIILKTIANCILGLSNRWNRNAYGFGIVGITEHLKLTIIATAAHARVFTDYDPRRHNSPPYMRARSPSHVCHQLKLKSPLLNTTRTRGGLWFKMLFTPQNPVVSDSEKKTKFSNFSMKIISETNCYPMEKSLRAPGPV